MSKRGERSRELILSTAKDLVMQRGFAGTSVDDILSEAGISKGAFFHHFSSKAGLAMELVRWHADNDISMFRTLAAEAEARHDDPYEQLMWFLQASEGHIFDTNEPSRGCMYAMYTYESEGFGDEINEIVSDTLRTWTAFYVSKFQEVIDAYPPAIPVTASQLAEMIVSLIEGGLVLQRAHGNTEITSRQSEHFRAWLRLLFPDAPAQSERAA